MPVPSATRFSIHSDCGVTTPVPTYPYLSKRDAYDEHDYFGGLGDRPASGISYRASESAKPYSYDTLGGADMIEVAPLPSRRSYSGMAPTSYERQLRLTPGPGAAARRPHSQSWGGDENYVADDSAGKPSNSFFRQSYTLPLSRSGRSGGQWRHIKQATGQTGSNLLFIEGTVKDHDVRSFPPFGILQPEVQYNRVGQRLLPRRLTESYATKQNQFNSRAKSGFQYWYNEPKSNISQQPKQPIRTISGHQFVTRGVGFHR